MASPAYLLHSAVRSATLVNIIQNYGRVIGLMGSLSKSATLVKGGDPYHGTDIIPFSHQSIGDRLAGFAMINDEGRKALNLRRSGLHNSLSTTLSPTNQRYDGLSTEINIKIILEKNTRPSDFGVQCGCTVIPKALLESESCETTPI